MKNSLWDEIIEVIDSSKNKISIYYLQQKDINILEEMGINENSTLGQVIYNTSGICIDGWIRVFGNGDNVSLRNINTYNTELKKYFGEGKLIVADDILGGLFALNRGSFEGKLGGIWYFAPDSLKWEDIQVNYPEFLAWIMSNNIHEFYQDFRWRTWRKDAVEVSSNQGVLIYPFLWSQECDIELAKKSIVPFEQLIEINLEYEKKLY